MQEMSNDFEHLHAERLFLKFSWQSVSCCIATEIHLCRESFDIYKNITCFFNKSNLLFYAGSIQILSISVIKRSEFLKNIAKISFD